MDRALKSAGIYLSGYAIRLTFFLQRVLTEDDIDDINQQQVGRITDQRVITWYLHRELQTLETYIYKKRYPSYTHIDTLRLSWS